MFKVPAYLFLAFAIYWYVLPDDERSRGPGVLAAEMPVQVEVRELKPWKLDDKHIVRPLARFSMKGRVLLKDRYLFGREAGVAPVDLTFGWGAMSDSRVLDKITLRHWHRYYTWYTKEFPIPAEEIIRSSANMHMVPANDKIAARMKRAIRGDLVELEGYLVEVAAADGWSWSSSMSREDSGNGACEVVWVERFLIEP